LFPPCNPLECLRVSRRTRLLRGRRTAPHPHLQ
jgi:hypothetical protein